MSIGPGFESGGSGGEDEDDERDAEEELTARQPDVQEPPEEGDSAVEDTKRRGRRRTKTRQRDEAEAMADADRVAEEAESAADRTRHLDAGLTRGSQPTRPQTAGRGQATQLTEAGLTSGAGSLTPTEAEDIGARAGGGGVSDDQDTDVEQQDDVVVDEVSEDSRAEADADPTATTNVTRGELLETEEVESFLEETGLRPSEVQFDVSGIGTGQKRFSIVVTEAGRERIQTEDIERQFEEQFGIDVEPGEDFTLVETDEGVVGVPTERFERQVTEQRSQLQAFQPEDVSLTVGELREEFQEDISQLEAFQQEDISLTLTELKEKGQRDIDAAIKNLGGGASSLAAVGGTDPADQSQQRAREKIEASLEESIEEQTGQPVDLDPETDIAFKQVETQEGLRIVGELADPGRRRVAVETAPIVGAAEFVGAGEDEARVIAGAAFEFREFGREKREQFVEPTLEGLRQSSVDVAASINQEVGFDELGPVMVRETVEDEPRPIEDVIDDVSTDISLSVDRAFPDADHPLVRDPVEAGQELKADISSTADRAFPSRDDPLVRDPIEAGKEISGDAGTLLDNLDEVDVSGKRLVAGAAAAAPFVATRAAAATPPGAIVVGGVLAAGATAQTIERLPPEQQLAVGEAVATGTSPIGQTRRAVTGADVGVIRAEAETPESIGIDQPEIQIDPETARERGIEIFREDIDIIAPELFPGPEPGPIDPEQVGPEIEIPEDPRPFSEEFLPVQEDPIFLPEVLVPTEPASQFTAGRHTPPEVPVEDVGTLGGPEVPVESEDLEGAEDFLFPGPEMPAAGRDATEEFPDPSIVGPAAAAPQAIQRQRRRPEVVEDPFDAGRERAPGGPEFIVRRSPRVSEPLIIDTGLAEIDLALVNPELARVLREGPELTGEDIFDRTLSVSRPGVDTRPEQVPGLFGFAEERDRLKQKSLAMVDAGVLEDTGLGEGVDEGVGQRLEQVQTPQLSQRTVTTPRMAFGTPTATPTAFDPRFEFPSLFEPVPEFITPTVTVPATGRPGRPLPGIDLDFDPDPRRRERRLDLFERRTEVLPGDPDEAIKKLDSSFKDDGFDDLLEGL